MTVIILLILASIATYSGVSTVRSARLTAFTTELKIMQTEANNLYDEYKEKPTEIGKEITGEAQTQFNTAIASLEADGISISSSDQANYRYFDQETIQSLEIEGVEGEFFVNVATRSIISYEGFNYENKRYYTLGQLPNGLYNVDYAENKNVPTFEVNYEDIGNNKTKVVISNIQYDGYIDKWQIKYKKEDQDYWNTTEDTEFIITEEGNYVFVIENGNVASVEKTVAINSNAEIGKRVEYTKKDNYTDAENNKATIPAGFAVSGIEEEQIISKGLVIYEIPEGIEEIDWSEKDSDGIYTVQKQYNQFVWIPVDGTNVKLEYSTISDNYTGSQSDYTENEEETPYEKYITNAKGYYIGRYENGVGTNGIPVIIRKANPSIVDWDTAKNKAENMYVDKDGYVSRMMTNKTWDTVINYMVYNGLDESEVLDSRNWGGYISDTQSYTTGSSETYNKFNIFDFAGNKSEWTADIYKNDENQRSIRDYWTGGSYVTFFQVLYHRHGEKTIATNYGYRTQLYITK